MGAALSIALLFTVSSTIVRVAGVFLEHTGLPRHVARTQALSGLSGTAFTTSESELILQTPVRRRILIYLMITGSLGLASAVATLVVGAFGVGETFHSLAAQVVAIVLAVLYIRYLLFSRWFDDLICGLAYRWIKSTMPSPQSMTMLYQLGQDTWLVEHSLDPGLHVSKVRDAFPDLKIVGRRTAFSNNDPTAWQDGNLGEDNVALAIGPEARHFELADTHGSIQTTRGHE